MSFWVRKNKNQNYSLTIKIKVLLTPAIGNEYGYARCQRLSARLWRRADLPAAGGGIVGAMIESGAFEEDAHLYAAVARSRLQRPVRAGCRIAG